MDLEMLRRRVQWSTGVAIVVFLSVMLAYVYKLWYLSSLHLADDPEAWGQFGDYVGGLLNPLIAFLAFYWLTQSVLLQKQELAETKDALKDSAGSQSRQVELAKRAAEINALSGLLSAYNSDLSRMREDSRFLIEQLTEYRKVGGSVRTPNGRQVPAREAEVLLAEMNGSIKQVVEDRGKAMNKLHQLLALSSQESNE